MVSHLLKIMIPVVGCSTPALGVYGINKYWNNLIDESGYWYLAKSQHINIYRKTDNAHYFMYEKPPGVQPPINPDGTEGEIDLIKSYRCQRTARPLKHFYDNTCMVYMLNDYLTNEEMLTEQMVALNRKASSHNQGYEAPKKDKIVVDLTKINDTLKIVRKASDFRENDYYLLYLNRYAYGQLSNKDIIRVVSMHEFPKKEVFAKLVIEQTLTGTHGKLVFDDVYKPQLVLVKITKKESTINLESSNKLLCKVGPGPHFPCWPFKFKNNPEKINEDTVISDLNYSQIEKITEAANNLENETYALFYFDRRDVQISPQETIYFKTVHVTTSVDPRVNEYLKKDYSTTGDSTAINVTGILGYLEEHDNNDYYHWRPRPRFQTQFVTLNNKPTIGDMLKTDEPDTEEESGFIDPSED